VPRQYFAGVEKGVRDVAERGPIAGYPVIDFKATLYDGSFHTVDSDELSFRLAGSLATRLLSDLGADVIKIESEKRLDPIRHIGPQPTDVVSLDTNGVFNDCGAGKRAVTINVDTVQGQELIQRLIPTVDVVTANYTPDRLDRWGFDYESLDALRPGIIVANIAVMGLSGPTPLAVVRQRAGGDERVAAHTGFDGRVPQCLGHDATDFTVPYFAADVLAALHHRDRTGEGAYLEMSQYESSVRLMDQELAEVLNGGGPAPAGSPIARRCDPTDFPAAGDDRWVAIACRDDAERARLAAVIGSEP
jgi:benzylsuccinate CoA-transferase BbsF subunit